MPTDVETSQDRDIEIDHTGDFKTSTGHDNIENQHVNAIFRGYEQADIGLNDRNTAENLRITIRRELEELGYVDSYTIETEPNPPNSITVRISTDVLDNPLVQEVPV